MSYSLNGKVICSFGKVSKELLKQFDLKQDVFYATIDWDMALDTLKSIKQGFKELPKFPAVRRDLALLLDSGIKFSRIREIAFNTEKNILRKVGLFDVYEDDSLGKNKKSYAISFILRDDKRTLTDKMIDRVMSRLIREYEKELGAIVR